MGIPVNIKRFAKAAKFQDVDFVTKWNDLDVYEAYSPDEPFTGYPQYILFNLSDSALRWANMEETEKIMEEIDK